MCAPPSAVIAGLDPAIHPLRKKFLRRAMDPRVKPAGDGSGWTPGSSPGMTGGLTTPRAGDGDVGENLVLLHARLGGVGSVDELQRAFSDERAREDHHADEAARPLGGLREYGLGPALVPRAARAVGGRAAACVDADAALDQAADARPLMAVGMGAAAGWERDAVAAQEQLARGQRV